jgi:hypothetical protein
MERLREIKEETSGLSHEIKRKTAKRQQMLRNERKQI